MDKKEEKSLYEQYQLHLALIKHTERVSTPKATFKAWLEGPDGVARRLGQQSLLPLLDTPAPAGSPVTAKAP